MDDIINLEKAFYDSVMKDVKTLKQKYGYMPQVFLNMIIEHGIIETAKLLIHSKEPSPGYTKLWERHALFYSIEKQIQDKRWHDLFTDDDREKAKKRLAEYGFIVK